jgi:hypothetical protein
MVSELTCTTERLVRDLDDSIGRFSLAWTGPWMMRAPDLPPGERVHPVVFDYPRVDLVELTIVPPPGFRTSEAPEPTELTGPYGAYRLAVARTGAAVKISRSLTLRHVRVPAEEYDALRAFLDDVRRADDTRVRFLRVEQD